MWIERRSHPEVICLQRWEHMISRLAKHYTFGASQMAPFCRSSMLTEMPVHSSRQTVRLSQRACILWKNTEFTCGNSRTEGWSGPLATRQSSVAFLLVQLRFSLRTMQRSLRLRFRTTSPSFGGSIMAPFTEVSTISLPMETFTRSCLHLRRTAD